MKYKIYCVLTNCNCNIHDVKGNSGKEYTSHVRVRGTCVCVCVCVCVCARTRIHFACGYDDEDDKLSVGT